MNQANAHHSISSSSEEEIDQPTQPEDGYASGQSSLSCSDQASEESDSGPEQEPVDLRPRKRKRSGRELERALVNRSEELKQQNEALREDNQRFANLILALQQYWPAPAPSNQNALSLSGVMQNLVSDMARIDTARRLLAQSSQQENQQQQVPTDDEWTVIFQQILQLPRDQQTALAAALWNRARQG